MEELRRLLQAIPPERAGQGLPASILRRLLLLLYGAGLRISEALQLKETDVDSEARLLSVHKSKFFKSRMVPIGPKLASVCLPLFCSSSFHLPASPPDSMLVTRFSATTDALTHCRAVLRPDGDFHPAM